MQMQTYEACSSGIIAISTAARNVGIVPALGDS